MSSPISPSGTSTPSSGLRLGVGARSGRPAPDRWAARWSRARRPRRRSPAGPARRPRRRTASRRPRGPAAARNGKHIAPPIRIVSATLRKDSITPILSLTLAPPSTATSGRDGFSSSPVSASTSRSSSSPAARLGDQPRHPLGRGVGAVRGPEGVVDVHVGQRGQLRGQLGVVLGLPRLEADVLEQQHVAGVRGLRPAPSPRRRRRRAPA